MSTEVNSDSKATRSVSKNTASVQPAHFCPMGGLQKGTTSYRYHEEVREVLHQRLRMAATILFCGFAAFTVRDSIFGFLPGAGEWQVLIPRLVVGSLIGSIALLLSLKPQLCTSTLRYCELLVFGSVSLQFVWQSVSHAINCPPDRLSEIAATFPYLSVIPWMIFIQIYGVLIPNVWKRTATVVGLMAIAPLAAAVIAATKEPVIAEVLREGGYWTMALLVGIVSVTSTYGSHRVGSLERKVFDSNSVGSYTLRGKVGAGGMGEVYMAEHRLLKRPCAIKLIRPDKADNENAIARFESEVQATAKLTHPNTIEIYDYGHTEDGTFYYAMEYLPGLSLQEIVDQYGPLPQERVVHLLVQVCSALSEAHSANLIHRDIKPGNIFAAERGGIHDTAKLLDFGLVKSHIREPDSLQLTMDGGFVGSPLYIAPEMTTGDHEFDARSDIYSLGATAYHMLTGQPVFGGTNIIKILFSHANRAPDAPATIRPEISVQLNSIVMKCLEKNPNDRFASVQDLEEAIRDTNLGGHWTQAQAREWWSSREASQSGGSDEHMLAETIAETGVLAANG